METISLQPGLHVAFGCNTQAVTGSFVLFFTPSSRELVCLSPLLCATRGMARSRGLAFPTSLASCDQG